jgi:hypothetical protein
MFILSSSALGASDCYRFTHNDHDVLLIGEVIETNETEFVISPEYFIVSAGEINVGSPRRQLQPDIARVMHGVQDPDLFQTGDYVIASLYQNEAVFEWAWGIYRVDSLDWQILTVSAGSNSEFFTNFVNSSENEVTPISVVLEESERRGLFWSLLLSVGTIITLVIGVLIFRRYKRTVE